MKINNINKINKKRASAFALALAICAGMLSGCGGANNAGQDNNNLNQAASGGVAVQVAPVTAETISTDNKVSGFLAAEDEATIMVAVSARCTDVYVKAGDNVRRGQVLCKLDLGSTLSQYSAARLRPAKLQ